MKIHTVRVYPSKVKLFKEYQLAWKLAEVAADRAPVTAAAQDMIINRIIDNAAVAVAAINRQPVCSARSQTLAHPRPSGATVFGLPAKQTFQAEYQAQALIDLAFRLRLKITNFDDIDSIVIRTSHHTHHVIGSGAGDPQKFDPGASRETLDHNIMYIFAVALQDGIWHHIDSYAPERARRPDTVRLWRKIRTLEDPYWTRRYHDPDPRGKAFGAAVLITLINGESLREEIALADAHPDGARPFGRNDYINKFDTLTEGIIAADERIRFIKSVQQLPDLKPEDMPQLNVQVPQHKLENKTRDQRGIF